LITHTDLILAVLILAERIIFHEEKWGWSILCISSMGFKVAVKKPHNMEM
jgi:hypothetical protein